VLSTLSQGEYLKALVMSFRLNERPLIQKTFEAVPAPDIRLVVRQLPVTYVPHAMRFLASHLEGSPHLEFDLMWSEALLMAHGRYLRDRSAEFASVFRVLQKGLADVERTISRLCDDNVSMLSYLIDQSKAREAVEASA